MNENETPETDALRQKLWGDGWSDSYMTMMTHANKLERERNQLRIKNENLLDAKIKAENAECLMEIKVNMMEQDIETIREIITKGGSAADILKFLDTPNA